MLFRYVSKFTNEMLILFTKYRQISMKYVSKFPAFESVPFMNLLP